MGIASQTRLQAYQLNKGGAPARLAILRMTAIESHRAPPSMHKKDWRAARETSINRYQDYFGLPAVGFNDGERTLYSHSGEVFRDEQDAEAINKSQHYSGHYTEPDRDSLAIGIVARLPHGRFVAGYRWTSNDERVYFAHVFDSEFDAARMADEHARVFAESAYDDARRVAEADDLQQEIGDACEELERAYALRNHPKRREHERESVAELIELIRRKRATLETDYKGVL